MNDLYAIKRLKQGDINGLEWLVNAYYEQAIRSAYLITGNAQTAEDVAQDAFLRAYQSINKFDDSRPFRPWFMRIVTNLAVQNAQKQMRSKPLEDEEENINYGDIVSAVGLTLEEQVEGSDLSARLWQWIQKLPPRQREVIVQRYYLEMSESEMAQELKVPPGTIKWLLNVARKSLSSMFKIERMKL